MSEAIKVVVRVRPMNTKQKERGCNSIVNADQNANQIQLVKPDQNNNTKSFAFDHVFNEQSQQEVVYSKTAYGLVQNVLLGYNGTIFAYGQTGCGKTHSMVGRVDVEELQGIIPRSFGHILSSISQTKNKEFLIRCSFIEIYNQQVRDLLSSDVKAKLQIKQSPDKGVFIKDLSQNSAKTHDELMQYMNIGNKNRSVGQTAMNKDSSRSHLLFMLYLQSAQITQAQQKKYVASKLNLVDLAGSQRLSKTGAEGDRLKQAQKINLSLSALGNVISALVDGKSHHIPYRDSKLTRLLQDSLGGNTKTVMIANCSPADYNYDQTLSTLRYASRAKFIKNKPIINEDPKDALLKEYAQQIKRLKMLISDQNGGGDLGSISVKPSQMSEQISEKLKQKERELNKQKQEKRKLEQKMKEFQHLHFFSRDVQLDHNIKAAIQRASVINKQNVKNLVQNKSQNDNIQEEEKKLQKGQGLINTQQIKLKYKVLVKKLKDKTRALQMELKDISHENYMDKEVILEDVRTLTKDNQLLQAIINILLRPHQIQAIKQAATYSEEKQQYKIPPFYMKSKQLVLPKLGQVQSIQMIRQMQEGRRLSWSNSPQQQPANKQPALKNNQNIMNNSSNIVIQQKDKKKFAINDIIKDARKDNLNKILPKDQRKVMRKLQLQPIIDRKD